MRLTGRILYLTTDPDLLKQQLEPPTEDGFVYKDEPLHYGVNTDLMISGAACTLGYTRDVLGPYFLEKFKEVVPKDGIRNGGFQVIVGGDAYGSGSSREVAVVAHQGAGIELVVARSFQRIFQENLVYGGVPFTTDMGVIARLQAGEEIDVREFTVTLPPFFRTVAESGGLLQYAHSWLAQKVQPWYDIYVPPRPLTIIEKIVARNSWTRGTTLFGMNSVQPGDQVLCRVGFVGMHEYTGGMVMDAYGSAFWLDPVFDSNRVACFEDHFVLLNDDTVPANVRLQRLAPSMALRDEMVDAAAAFGLRVHGPGRDLPAGVCHRIVVEQYANPGEIVILTDSHTPTAGVLNTFAFGVGSTAAAFALRTGTIPVTVPNTVRINVTGQAGKLTPKDLILHIIGDHYFREEQWRRSPTDTCVIEFGGEGLEQWSVDELSVLTNMTVEGGLMTGVIEPNEAVIQFLMQQRGLTRQQVEAMLVYPDEGCEYTRVFDIDLAEVPLTVATPGDSRNRKPLEEVGKIAIHNVVIASCTGGSLADLRAAAAVLSNRNIASGVRLTVTPSSSLVAEQAEAEGILAMFRAKGANVTPPGCGSCIGNGPGIPLPGETTASTTNRNFDRRMGAPGPVYLVSPAVATASAVTGFLTDPRCLPQM